MKRHAVKIEVRHSHFIIYFHEFSFNFHFNFYFLLYRVKTQIRGSEKYMTAYFRVCFSKLLHFFVTFCTAGEWFCSASCEVAAGRQTDHVRNYSLAVIWYGLLDLCHHDAIREADGLAMMTMWRVNMIRFWNSRLDKYLSTGHRLLAGS